MRLPSAGRPNQEDVLPTVEILALHKFEHLRLVDAWPCREVELVEQFRSGESRRLEPPFRRLPLPLDEFKLDELQEERQVIGVVGRTRLGDLLGFGLCFAYRYPGARRARASSSAQAANLALRDRGPLAQGPGRHLAPNRAPDLHVAVHPCCAPQRELHGYAPPFWAAATRSPCRRFGPPSKEKAFSQPCDSGSRRLKLPEECAPRGRCLTRPTLTIYGFRSTRGGFPLRGIVVFLAITSRYAGERSEVRGVST